MKRHFTDHAGKTFGKWRVESFTGRDKDCNRSACLATEKPAMKLELL